jgi:hypothetical protein
VLGTASVGELGGSVELLTTDAVTPAIAAFIDVPGSRAARPELAHRGRVTGIGAGMDEIIESDAERSVQRLEVERIAPDEIGHP